MTEEPKSTIGVVAAITYVPFALILYAVVYPSDAFNLLQRGEGPSSSWKHHGYGGQAPQDGGESPGHWSADGPGGTGDALVFPPTPRRSRLAAAIPVVLASLVIVAIGLIIAFPAHRDSATEAPSVKPSHIPGWHTVVAAGQGLTYEVPPTWSVKPPTTIVGFTDAYGTRIVGGSGAAVYKEGHCPGRSGSFRAETAVTEYPTTAPVDPASDAAYKWATYRYAPDNNSPAPNITVASHLNVGVNGSQETAIASVLISDHSSPCSPPLATVRAIAIEVRGKISVLIIIADQIVTDAAPESDLQKIADSLHPTT